MQGRNAGPRIGPIVGVTIATPDLAASEQAYVGDLGYRARTRGRVTEAQARAWDCPATAGARFMTLQPAAADDFEFRFVESATAGGYRAFSTFGWNAAELIVQDVDAMADELRGSAFEMLGPPQDLSFTDAIRAMQVRGPGGEILYLTQFKRELDALPAPLARCKVDRVFIVIVGGRLAGRRCSMFYTSRVSAAARRSAWNHASKPCPRPSGLSAGASLPDCRPADSGTLLYRGGPDAASRERRPISRRTTCRPALRSSASVASVGARRVA